MKGFIESGSGSIKDRSHGGSLNRDDRVHGSLLITIELFMNCVLKAEVYSTSLHYFETVYTFLPFRMFLTNIQNRQKLHQI